MPGVFTVGAFKTQDSSLTLTVDLRQFFANLLDTMKNWADKARPQIIEHNSRLEVIKKDVLMTMNERINHAVAEATYQLTSQVQRLDEGNRQIRQ